MQQVKNNMITLSVGGKCLTIEDASDETHLNHVINSLILPALVALGYWNGDANRAALMEGMKNNDHG